MVIKATDRNYIDSNIIRICSVITGYEGVDTPSKITEKIKRSVRISEYCCVVYTGLPTNMESNWNIGIKLGTK